MASSVKVTTMPSLAKLYPDEFEGQCAALKNFCPNCGKRFEKYKTECKCGTKRPRCQNKAMRNEDVCVTHAKNRAYKLYSKLAATISDSQLEEFIEKDQRDLTQEFALARIALSGALDNRSISSEQLMSLVKEFFDIALKKKRIEEGDLVNIQWNDDMANALRLRFRNIIKELGDTLKAHLTDDVLRADVDKDELLKKIFYDLKKVTKLLGNKLTAPLKEEED